MIFQFKHKKSDTKGKYNSEDISQKDILRFASAILIVSAFIFFVFSILLIVNDPENGPEKVFDYVKFLFNSIVTFLLGYIFGKKKLIF
jgi:Trk-type K+ transport system membrane component